MTWPIKKYGPLIYIALFLAALSAGLFFYAPHRKALPSAEGRKIEKAGFMAENVLLKKKEGERTVFSISVRRVLSRNRSSKFFVYHNLKEMYMSGVTIDAYASENRWFRQGQKIAASYSSEGVASKRCDSRSRRLVIPLAEIGISFTAFGDPSTSIRDYLAGCYDINLEVLTRFVIDDLMMHIHLPERRMFSILAKHARINMDAENIIFDGQVSFLSSRGQELSATQAVWSGIHDGIYFPNGYTSRDGYHEGKTFLIVDRYSRISKAYSVPDTEYTDFVERGEKILYDNISKKTPPYLRAALGISSN